MASKSFLIFLMVVLFFLSLSIILFELALTRIFSIVLWYDYAFMAISIAFFGLGIGSFVIHFQRGKIKKQKEKSTSEPQFAFSSRIVQFAIAYGISVPVFIFLIGYIPSNTSYIYLFYLVSSIRFFFAGACMALIFLAMSERISKLYFADLIGAASATIILDPVMQTLGAGSVLLLTSIAVVGAAACSYYFVFIRDKRDKQGENLHYHVQPNATIKRERAKTEPQNRLNLFAVITFAGLVILLIVNSVSSIDIFEIKPGVSKGLYYQLSHPSEFDHLSEEWNSFSRVDISHKIIKQEDNNVLGGGGSAVAITPTSTTDTDTDSDSG